MALQRVKDTVRRIVHLVGSVVIIALMVGSYLWYKGWDPRNLLPSNAASGSPTPSVTPAPEPTSDPRVVRVGVDDRAACLPFWGASEFLAGDARTLQIQIVPVPDAQMRWQMLSAGRLDLACGTLDGFTVAAARGNRGALIFKIGTSSGADVLVTAPDINNVRGLAGKRVALVSGRPGAWLLGYFLDKAGMSPSEVQIVETDDVQDAVRLLQARKVAAAWLWSPHAQALVSRGFRVLASSAEHEIVQEICAASPAALRDARASIEAVMRAWFSVVNLLGANPGLAKEPIARNAKLKPALAGMLLSEVHFTDLLANKRLDGAVLLEQMQQIQDFFKIAGGARNLTQPIDAQSLRLDLVQDVEVNTPTSIFGQPTPRPEGIDHP